MNNGPRYDRFPLKLICLLVAAIIGLGSTQVQAAPVDQLSSGTSSQKARRAAFDAIPFHELTQETQNKIAPIMKKPSIYRRLPITAINVDRDYFVFLVRYPEVIVNIWKIMGVTKMVTSRTAPFQFTTNDGAGTISNVELIYGTPNLHIFYGEGTYEGPVLKRKLRGKCVLVLRTDFSQNAEGKSVATSSLDVFLKVENATASLIAKTLNPIVGKTADHNFIESLNFVQRLNDTTLKNGPGVQRMANRLTDINNDVRNDFVQMAGLVYGKKASAASTPEANGIRASFRQSGTSHPTMTHRQMSGYLPTNFPNGGAQVYQHANGSPINGHGNPGWNQYNFSSQGMTPSSRNQPPSFQIPSNARTLKRSLPPIVSPDQIKRK